MIEHDRINWKPLGTGRQAPPGSISDRKLAGRLAAYKSQVAGRYQSVAPQDILRAIAPGEYIISPKIDGETWFLLANEGTVYLISPSGKLITGIPVTEEAARILGNRRTLLVGELYANGQPTRPRVHDLHAALGGEENAQINHLHFAAFDLLEDGNGNNCQRHSFTNHAQQLMELLAAGKLCHSVTFEKATDARGILNTYERLVTRQGHEGIVVRSADGGICKKIKPEIRIDAVVVGMTLRTDGGIAELLLALQYPDGKFQLLGRVDTGFSEAERYDLARRLQPLAAQSSYLAASRSGALFQFIQPEVVIEVKCNDLLTTRADGEPIRRMVIEYTQGAWQPIRPIPAVSMINAVFRRIRDDKTVNPDAIRISQVTDLVSIEAVSTAPNIQLPCSTVLRREVFSKTSEAGLCVRKAVIWKTNKETVDPLYPVYVTFFTDFAPGRAEPLKTDIRIASTLEKINTLAETWLAEKITHGWTRQAGTDIESNISTPALPASCTAEQGFRLNLELSFARTPSVNFHVAVRRIKTLAQAGNLTVENDDHDCPRHYILAINQNILVENIRRIENLHRLIFRWKSAEFLVNGDPLGYHEAQGVLNTINDIAACWRTRKNINPPCRSSLILGCNQLLFKPSAGFPGIARDKPAWYAVGKFDGKTVTLDKESLLAQLSLPANESLTLCPLFNREQVIQRIQNLPDILDPAADGNRWVTGYNIDSHKSAWVFPKNIRHLPFDITLESNANQAQSRQTPFGFSIQPLSPATSRNIPITRYADVCGQDEAVELVRDYAELPLKHAELFQRMNVRPGRGLLLYGPPGNGKTLLARAVAGESGAHIETIAGSELLSKWIGESEKMLREIFQRATQFTPAVIIMDEVDAIAGSRDSSDFNHLRELVSQLLVLMDGLSDRGRILIIATTNLPDHLDPAILRPGRLDRKIFIGPPNRTGRIALLNKLLSRMPTANDVQPENLADLTHGLSGAEIEHITNEAGLLAIKESLIHNTPTESVQITNSHFLQAFNISKKYTEKHLLSH